MELSRLDPVYLFHVRLQFLVCKAQEWGASRDAADMKVESKVSISFSKITCCSRLAYPLLPSRPTFRAWIRVSSFCVPLASILSATAPIWERRPS